MNMKRIFSALALWMVSDMAMAACSWGTGIGAVGWNISPGTVKVKSSDPVGKVLYTRQLTSAQNTGVLLNCTANEVGRLEMLTGSPVVGQPNTYSTNIPGIGIRIKDKTGRYFGQPGDNIPTTPARGILVGDIAPLTFDIIKTDTTPTGGVLNNVSVINFTVPGLTTVKFTAVMGTGSIVQDNSCTVSTSTIPVDMGNTVTTSEFKGVGTTIREKDLAIPLVCDQFASVNVTFDGLQAAGYPNILALNPVADAATGVGIQLLNKSTGTPVPLKSPISMGTAPGTGPLDLEFTARYYQTADRVTGGPAGANATFTMTYN